MFSRNLRKMSKRRKSARIANSLKNLKNARIETVNKYVDETEESETETSETETSETETSGAETSDSSIMIIDNSDERNLRSPEIIEVEEPPERTKEIFYKLSVDTSFHFPDKEVIKINKAMLYLHARSNAMFQMLFTSSNNNVIQIADINAPTFKLFLDCVMGFAPYTFDNAVIIFPVVCKYQIEKSIQDCINALEPKEMNESICKNLNMAVSLKCEDLINKITDFIHDVYNPYRFLENEAYCSLLEPDSLVQILKKIRCLDSLTVSCVMQWGHNYLKRNKNYESVKALFEAFQIVKYLKRCLLNFGAPEVIPYPTNDFLTEIIPRRELFSLLTRLRNIEHRKSEWKTMSKGDSLTEEIIVKSIKCEKSVNLIYHVLTNFIIFYEVPRSNEDEKVLFSADMRVEGQANHEYSWCYENDNERTNRVINRYLDRYTATRYRLKSDNLSDQFILRIKYKFLRDCRILLKNRPNKNDNSNLETLYFTKDVVLTGLS